MAKKKQRERPQFRFYEMPHGAPVLALLGEDWIRPYGEGIDDLHFHNYMEIGICHEGDGIMIIEDRQYTFQPGDIAIIPSNIPHTTISRDYQPAFWEWMYVDIPLVLKSIDRSSSHKIKVEELERVLNRKGLFLHERDEVDFARIIRQIRDECENRSYLFRERIWALLQVFTIELLRMKNLKEENIKKDKINLVIRPAIDYAKKHYQESIRIENLAETCGLSESHFRRLFRECMNMSPQDYIAMIRIKQACDLISETDESMSNVAYKVGFSNVSSFNRTFKKLMDITPYQWKQSLNENSEILHNFNVKALKGW